MALVSIPLQSGPSFYKIDCYQGNKPGREIPGPASWSVLLRTFTSPLRRRADDETSCERRTITPLADLLTASRRVRTRISSRGVPQRPMVVGEVAGIQHLKAGVVLPIERSVGHGAARLPGGNRRVK